jgi:hypothetical protein
MAKIYLSATYADLKLHRDVVYRILRMLRHDVIAMEDYVANDAFPLQKCLADVAGSNLYVGLVGWRYGYVPGENNPDGKSITELEYRQAQASSLPQLMFLADRDTPWPDEHRDAHTGENENGKRIADFRADLENARLVSYFRSPDHLAGLVSVAVQRCLDELPAAGRALGSRLQQVRREALERRLDSLLQDYQAATAQLAYTLASVDRNRLERQVQVLERELEELESTLETI